MVVYHGTTRKRAKQICLVGFRPRKPSKRVWFAESRGYALGRAKTQARRSNDKAVVLTCDINIAELRRRYGPKRVAHRNRVIAIDAPVPVSVLRSYPAAHDQPASPGELAAWVNDLLGLKPHKGVSPAHEGVGRLSRWLASRMADRPTARIRPTELLAMARRWLPNIFEGYEVDFNRLRAYRTAETVSLLVEAPDPDEREEGALDLLIHRRAKRRAQGLARLAELEVEDLFDWCVMFLGDESVSVRAAALRAMLGCREVDLGLLEPLARSEAKRVRAAAIAALARHSGDDAPTWFERGLKDPSPCVRLETAAQLHRLDATEHRRLFELALHDPNPHVVRAARRLTGSKDYAKAALRAGRAVSGARRGG